MQCLKNIVLDRIRKKTMTNSINQATNILNHVKSSDFIRNELLNIANDKISQGKNALIFKAYLENKQTAKIDLLINLGYDFSIVASTSSCDSTQLKNRLAKFKKAIEKEYLFKIANMFQSFVKEPTVKKLNLIREFNNLNSQIVKAIVKKEITDILFSDSLEFSALMTKLPTFLNVNYIESLTGNDNPKLEVESPMIETNNFNHIKAYIDNDADIATLELMQALITAKLDAIKTAKVA